MEDLAVDSQTKYLLSVAADNCILLHDIASGEIAFRERSDYMRCCCFAPGRLNLFAVVTAALMGRKPILSVFQLAPAKIILKHPQIEFEDPINGIIWPSDDQIIVGDERGHLIEISGAGIGGARQIAQKKEAHRGAINSLTLSFDRSFFASASADTTAITWNTKLERLETFPHSFIVSCCAISPHSPHIVLASSADKRTVAQSSFGSTDFTINFFHLVFSEEFASIKVCKSTVNWVVFSPDGWTVVTTCHEGTFLVLRLGGDYAEICQEHHREMEVLRQEMDGH